MIVEIDASLKLRQIEMADADAIFETINSQRTYLEKWLPFVMFTKKVTDTEAFIKTVIEAPEECFEYVFTIREDARFVGLISFKETDRINGVTEIGYWLSENDQKKGIVSRSVIKLCDFAFDTLQLNKVLIKCAVGNFGSINIPKKLGFTFEGIEPDGEMLSDGNCVDLEVYCMKKKGKEINRN